MNTAFIPVRGGSKSIPLKNIREICGKPLVYWTSQAANNAKCIDKVVIATDSAEIKAVVNSFGLAKVQVYDRNSENAQDSSSTESVMLEYIEQSGLDKNDSFFLIQATSPMLKSEHIDEMYNQFLKEKSNSAFSCVVTKHFFWTNDGKPINYDYRNRPRRQDFEGYLQENGACYINSVENILKDKNRISGKKTLYIMPEYTSYEIDEPDDFLIIEELMKKHKYV